MLTKILNATNQKYNLTEVLQLAVITLQHNNLIAFPTETVYGLAARVFSPEAIAKIYQVKGRPSDNPLIAHISNIEQANQLSDQIPPAFYTLAKAFFPGPLTLVISKKPTVPDIGTSGQPTIGIRMPAHPFALQLIDALQEPIFAPSANLSGKPSPTTAAHVYQDLNGKIPLIIDGGPCQVGIESTVLDLTQPTPTILRPGIITAEQISDVLNQPIQTYQSNNLSNQSPKAPGMKYRHYAPQAKVIIVTDWHNYSDQTHTPGNSLILTPNPNTFPYHPNIPKQQLNTATLFAHFRQADQEHKQFILIDATNKTQTPPALWNRIEKAASKE